MVVAYTKHAVLLTGRDSKRDGPVFVYQSKSPPEGLAQYADRLKVILIKEM